MEVAENKEVIDQMLNYNYKNAALTRKFQLCKSDLPNILRCC